MKIFVYEAWDCIKSKIVECESLEKCCDDLLETEKFYNWLPSLIVSKPEYYIKTHMNLPGDCADCDYVVMIYNNYIE